MTPVTAYCRQCGRFYTEEVTLTFKPGLPDLSPDISAERCDEWAGACIAKGHIMIKKEDLLGLVEDSVSELIHYGRKGDEDVPRGSFESSVGSWLITIDELVEHFRKHLTEALAP